MDQYAQELRKLFYKAYPKASQAAAPVEEFGKSVLAYQFVAGLIPAVQLKMLGLKEILINYW